MSRTELIIRLIGTQDVRKWDEQKLYDWAAKMADIILSRN